MAAMSSELIYWTPWGIDKTTRDKLEGPLEVGSKVPQQDRLGVMDTFRELYPQLISRVPAVASEYPTFDSLPLKGECKSVYHLTANTGISWDCWRVRLTLSTPSYHVNIDCQHSDWVQNRYACYNLSTTFGVYTDLVAVGSSRDYDTISTTPGIYYKRLAGTDHIMGVASLLSALDTVISYSNEHAGAAPFKHYLEVVLRGWRDIVDEPRRLAKWARYDAISEQCNDCYYHHWLNGSRICGVGVAIEPGCTHKEPTTTRAQVVNIGRSEG